jgi:hypothetical protein
MKLASTQYGQIVWQAFDESQSTGITIPEMHVFWQCTDKCSAI